MNDPILCSCGSGKPVTDSISALPVCHDCTTEYAVWLVDDDVRISYPEFAIYVMGGSQ
jgi:hypothetical protein